MYLIMIPLLLLIGVGAFANNLAASGMQPTPDSSSCTSLNCPAYEPTACNASVSNCNFTSSTSFSVLSPNSPFTYIFSGDLSGFLSSFTNSNGQSQSLNALSVCETPEAGKNITFLHCTSSSWGIKGPPYQQYPIVSCNMQGAMGLGFNATSSGSAQTTPSGQANFSTWTITGCAPANSQNTNPLNQTGFLQIQADYAGANGSMTLTRYEPGLADIIGSGGTSLNLLSFFGFLIGIILFVMSFGIGFGGGANVVGSGPSFQFSANSQGTRLAQVFGIGLMLYAPIYSEFSSWIFTLGFGVGAMISLIIPAMFFVGLYWQMESFQ